MRTIWGSGAAAWAGCICVWVGHSAFSPTSRRPVCLLILRKISKIGATICFFCILYCSVFLVCSLLRIKIIICQILRLKCTKFAFQESLQRSTRRLAVFKGSTSNGREEKGRKGKGKRKWRDFGPPKNFGMPPCGLLLYMLYSSVHVFSCCGLVD